MGKYSERPLVTYHAADLEIGGGNKMPVIEFVSRWKPDSVWLGWDPSFSSEDKSKYVFFIVDFLEDDMGCSLSVGHSGKESSPTEFFGCGVSRDNPVGGPPSDYGFLPVMQVTLGDYKYNPNIPLMSEGRFAAYKAARPEMTFQEVTFDSLGVYNAPHIVLSPAAVPAVTK